MKKAILVLILTIASLAFSTVPDWVNALPDNGTWTELSASPVFVTWLTANITPAGGYLGSGPFSSIRDAYCYPAWDGTNKSFYLWGGGHQDGSCNVMVKFDAATLSYSIAIPPTPPSCYPPAFTAPNAPLVYPSGSSTGYFQTTATLTDARDIPYAAPFAAPASSHTYSGLFAFGGKVLKYYGGTFIANLADKSYDVSDMNRLGPQLHALQPNEGSEQLGECTHVVVDEATGKAWVAANPGSAGDNWRSHLCKVDAATSVVEALVGVPSAAPDWSCFVGSESMCINGRQLFALSLRSFGNTQNLRLGWFVNLDSLPLAAKRFDLTGDLPVQSSQEENMPCFSDGTYVYVWNYYSEPDCFYRIDPKPLSGAGSGSDPYILTITKINLPTSAIPRPNMVYRLDYIPEWGVVMVLPKSNSRWWALKTGNLQSTAENKSFAANGMKLTCQPNPFRPSTCLEYNLGKAVSGNLAIYNVAGIQVRGFQVNGSSHNVIWDGKDQSNQQLPSGTYIARLVSSGNKTLTHSLILSK